MTRRLIRELSEEPDPERSIAMIESPGLAEVHHSGGEVELVLPEVIRDVLRQAYVSRDPHGARAMHLRLAAWYSAQGGDEYMLMAFHHAAAGQDWVRLDEIWDGHVAALGMRYPAAVATVLRELPKQVIDSRYGMRVVLATSAVAATALDCDADGRMATLRAYAETSTRIITRHLNELKLPDLLLVGSWHMVGHRLAGRFDEAVRVGDDIERRAEVILATGATPGDYGGWFDLQRGLTWTLLGEYDKAITCYQLCWQRGLTAAPFIPANAAANLALAHALRGERDQAQRWLQRYEAFDTAVEWGSVGIGARLASGLLALDQLKMVACETQLEMLGDGRAPVELWPYVAHLHAKYGLHQGDPAIALDRLDAARRAHPRALANQGVAATLLTRTAADLLIADGLAQRASQLLARAADPTNPMLAVPRARISLLAGDHASARTITTEVLRQQKPTDRERLDLLLLQALAVCRMNDMQYGRILMRQALETVSRTGVLRSLTTLQADELDMLLDLAGARLDPAQQQTIRAHHHPYPDRVRMVRLTQRERQLAAALATNASRQEIANQLHVSINTVKKQFGTLYRKLGATTRDQALTQLRQHGLI